jgi:hypothetical protein
VTLLLVEDQASRGGSLQDGRIRRLEVGQASLREVVYGQSWKWEKGEFKALNSKSNFKYGGPGEEGVEYSRFRWSRGRARPVRWFRATICLLLPEERKAGNFGPPSSGAAGTKGAPGRGWTMPGKILN